jgi:aspartate/methionine/tyrosine aminotransferase
MWQVMYGDVYAEVGKPENLHHQYSRPGGEPGFATMLAERYGKALGQELTMENVVTTIGAQEGIYTTMHAFCDPGDEVLVITPAFDATFKSAALLGLLLKGVSLKPDAGTAATSSRDYKLDIEELKAAIGPKTKLLVLNTPSSPLGKVYTREELQAISAVVSEHPSLIVLADEVYEASVFEGSKHHRFASLPGAIPTLINALLTPF